MDMKAKVSIADFLSRYVEDEDRGEVQTHALYQTLYPGFEEAVAREFLDLEEWRRTREARAEDERRLGHYRLLHPLDRGGQDEVHLAEDVPAVPGGRELHAPGPTTSDGAHLSAGSHRHGTPHG